jgi:hypothetical protein
MTDPAGDGAVIPRDSRPAVSRGIRNYGGFLVARRGRSSSE